MNTAVFNKTARAYWALQAVRLEIAARTAGEPVTKDSLDRIKKAQRVMLERAALPQQHCKPAVIHPYASQRTNDPMVTRITEHIANVLRERAQVIWRLQSDENRPDWVDKELENKVQALSEELATLMWILRRLRYRYGFGDVPPHTTREEAYRRIHNEANEINTFGNGDQLLADAADRLRRNKTHD